MQCKDSFIMIYKQSRLNFLSVSTNGSNNTDAISVQKRFQNANWENQVKITTDLK